MDDLTESLHEALREYRQNWTDRTPRYDRDIDELPAPRILDQTQYDEVEEYLADPVRTGIWYARMVWLDNAPISLDLWTHVRGYVEPMNGTDRPHGPGDERRDRAEQLYNRAVARLTTWLKVFAHVCEFENTSAEETKYMRYASWRDRQILRTVDCDKIRTEYHEAYDIFKEHILNDSFTYVMASDKAFRMKSGFVSLVTGPARSSVISMCSTRRESLEIIGRFLSEIGKVDSGQTVLSQERSMESNVLAPYVALLELARPLRIEQEDGRSVFDGAIREYRAGRYDNCIRAVGIECERYLRQVYEAHHKKECWDTKMTMGTLLNMTIVAKVDKEKRQNGGSLSALENALQKFHKNVERSGTCNADVARAFIAQAVQALEPLHSEVKDDTAKPIVDKSARRVLDEILEYRNLVSHRSHRTVGAFEAQRALYCMVWFLNWWRERKTAVS